MKIPDWLPDSHRPTRPDGGSTEPIINRLTEPFAKFFKIEAAGGIVLLCCALIALGLANSPWAAAFASLWHTNVGVTIGDFALELSLQHWINDGAMTIFFFVVGLEIKRELVHGELREPRNAVLPAVAALGGMLVPAALFLLFQHGKPGADGWAIPMATDIAFVAGFLALLGARVAFGLKILILTLAIIDDIGAVLIIAVAFTDHISLSMLGWAGVGLGVTLICRWLGVRAVPVYVLIGVGIWLAVLMAGVHATVAGVVLGLLTPSRPWLAERSLLKVLSGTERRLRKDREKEDETEHHEEAVLLLGATAQETISPLDRLENALHPWVAFVIMPLFALANAGVRVDLADLAHPVSLATAAGLAMGKPLGIVMFSALAVRLGWARLPEGVNWKVLTGAGCLAGIGFTMSLFIAGLALGDELLESGKIGALVGSALSAMIGCTLLWWFLREEARSEG
ncbi:MAG: Na+/H+ antiporter NhaA [Verrucomicrobiales bacterium]|nr:Na+/H+ antiporter NhaA [Verrucomicrobiales bacterium]